MREVCVYDGDFPTFEQMLAGGAEAAFPKEIWLPQVQPGEFAVRYKDFKTGLARTPAGKHVQSSEVCRIFSSMEEARANSSEVASAHWTVRCFIYDHTGAQVGTISNNKEVGKFALVAYAGILIWVGVFAAIGMGLLWMLSKLALLALGPFPSMRGLLSNFGWFGWATYAFAGLLVGILVWYWRIRFAAKKRVDHMQNKLNAVISPEEKKRFEELHSLHGSKDPAERERLLKLATEYQTKITKALKK